MNTQTKLPGRKSKEWTTKSIKAYVMLMMLFLRVSPSYALAHAFATRKVSAERERERIAALYQDPKGQALDGVELEAVIADFARVRQTYAEFGDVYSLDFEEWWEARALKIYGFEGVKPKVRQLASFAQGGDMTDEDKVAMRRYLRVIRPAEARPPALLISVPLGVSRKELLAQVSKLIDAANVPVTRKAHMAKRPFTAKRLRSEPLFLAMRLLWAKIKFPKMTLWKLGALMNVSPSNDLKGHPLDAKRTMENLEVRNRLGVLTHRMLKKAQTIAEHAARGDFPCGVACRLPNLNLAAARARINRSKKIVTALEPTGAQTNSTA